MTSKSFLISVTWCVLASSGLAFGAIEYGVDPNHSYIGFKARHMTVTNVRGEFTKFSSKFMVDEENHPFDDRGSHRRSQYRHPSRRAR